MSKTAPHPDNEDAAAVEPTANERGERARTWIGWSCAVLGLPLIYFLSVGPAIFISDKLKLGETWLTTTYQPLIWLHRNTPLRPFLEWYAGLWT